MRIDDLSKGYLLYPEVFMESICAQAELDGRLPYLLSYAPVAQLNPYQRLLYSRASQMRFAVVPILKLEELGVFNWGVNSVIHLHWLGSVLADAKNSTDAERMLLEFQRRVMSWKDQGHKLVWTMHNVLPHHCKYSPLEIRLREFIIRQCDAVHILCRDSGKYALQYDLPKEKTFHVAHPSYEGWYANLNDRVSARLDLGMRHDDFVFLQFGALQEYKGILELILSFKKLQELRPEKQLKLIIAGKPTSLEYQENILSEIKEHPNIQLISRKIEEKEIQTLFNGSDVVVAPYKTILNSGTALLAATFRKSFVAPKTGGIKETFHSDTTLLYSGDKGDQLIEAMLRSMSHKLHPKIFSEILKHHSPANISGAFFNELERRVFSNAGDK